MSVEVLEGDCRAILPTLVAESVHCVVTSPPYWGLRDYGTASWEGGEVGCEHRGGPMRTYKTNGGSVPAEHREFFRDRCPCGAMRIDAQLGLEPTPEDYVAHMVTVFREVRRVLRDDGTCWINMGDGYASGEVGRHDHAQAAGLCAGSTAAGRHAIGLGMNGRQQRRLHTGLKAKDLVGMPWRLAFALQADGWFLRADIIWAKPNPMPESVTDRPTKAHEYVFLLSKSARYYYDADAVREEVTGNAHSRGNGVTPKSAIPGLGIRANGSFHAAVHDLVSSRNLRTVWTIATEPTPEAHFATFPQALAARCILAGCPAGGTVLDPFAGTGTVGQVAERSGRHSILVELNPRYIELLRVRTAQRGLFTWRPALAEPAP